MGSVDSAGIFVYFVNSLKAFFSFLHMESIFAYKRDTHHTTPCFYLA